MSGSDIFPEVTPSRTEQIRSFMQLPDGWHYGEGRSATHAAVVAALGVEALFREYGAQEVEVFPGVDGGILTSGYHENDALEIRCNPSGQMDMWHEANDEPVDSRKNTSLEEIGSYLGDLEWKPKSSLDCYILNISAVQEGDLQVRLSNRLLQTAGFLFSILAAPSVTAETSASMLLDTMKVHRATWQFYGESFPKYYRENAPSHVSLQQAETHAIGISADSRTINVAA